MDSQVQTIIVEPPPDITLFNEIFQNPYAEGNQIHEALSGWNYDYDPVNSYKLKALILPPSSVGGSYTNWETRDHFFDVVMDMGGCTTTCIGDVNNDGGVNIMDIVPIVDCILNPDNYICSTPHYNCAANTMEDEMINIQDILYLVNAVLDETAGCPDWNPCP